MATRVYKCRNYQKAFESLRAIQGNLKNRLGVHD